jgi:hypothetical protein
MLMLLLIEPTVDAAAVVAWLSCCVDWLRLPMVMPRPPPERRPDSVTGCLEVTIKVGSARAHIHWASGLFDGVKRPLLGVLEHFESLRRLLDVPDGLLLQLLAVSATAIVQPLAGLKIRRWVLLFIFNKVGHYLIYSCLRTYPLGCGLI